MRRDADVECVRELLDAFKIERIVNVVMALSSFVAQVVFIAIFATTGKSGPVANVVVPAIVAAPSGLLLATMGRALKMWTDSLRYLRELRERGPAGGGTVPT